MRFSTRAIHAGGDPDPATGAIMPPVYLTSTYVQTVPLEQNGFDYARTRHPTRDRLQENLASLEGATQAVAFSSGCAAANTVMNLLSTGDHVVSTQDVYGGTYRLFTQVFQKMGIGFTFLMDPSPDAFMAACTDKTRVLWIETPSNPLLTSVDIQAVSEVAKDKGILLVVDNTFATPYLQNPLNLGAEVVAHSTTKYLGGHSDVVGGVLVTCNEELAERFRFFQNSVGAVPGPLDCFLVMRGTKTLALRMERHCDNAERIATFLDEHPKVGKVYYPGLTSHGTHDIAKKQMSRFGGMISFELASGKYDDSLDVLRGTRLFALAESLGGVESLIEHPASMTHGSIPREERIKYGLTDTLIRLSVGCEDIEDLLEDLEGALSSVA